MLGVIQSFVLSSHSVPPLSPSMHQVSNRSILVKARFSNRSAQRLESRSGWDTFQRPPFGPLAQLRDTLL